MTKRKAKSAQPTQESALERWYAIRDLIRLALLTGHIKGERPQSVILVGPPADGKTELVNLFRVNHYVEHFSDLTFQPVLKVLKNAMMRRTTAILIPEFQKLFFRRRAVAQQTVGYLLMAMDEGVEVVEVGPRMLNFRGADGHGTRFGVIAATTTVSLERNRELFYESGLDSRCFFVYSGFTAEHMREIRDRMARGDLSMLDSVSVPIPKAPVAVTLPVAIAKELDGWVDEMHSVKGLRVAELRQIRRFQSMAKAVALSHGRKEVTRADLAELYKLRQCWLTPVPVHYDSP